jgi:hypothetical protein
MEYPQWHLRWAGTAQLESVLRDVSLGEATSISQELVSLLWYLPLVLIWNSSRVDPRWYTELELRTRRIENEVLRILGDPRTSEMRPAAPEFNALFGAWAPKGFFSQLGKDVIDLEAARKILQQVTAFSAEPKELL